mgnify:CR=1 FL=1
MVLYCSWVGQGRLKGAWEREGSPAYAFNLPGVPRTQYQLVYDAEGKYMLTESSPANTQEANAKGAAKRRSGGHPARLSRNTAWRQRLCGWDGGRISAA